MLNLDIIDDIYKLSEAKTHIIVIWTKEIPKSEGVYLIKNRNHIDSMRVTKRDLEIQKEDSNWLKTDYWSLYPIFEVKENEK